MVDGDLPDPESACRRQNRNETVQLTIETDFPEYSRPITLHAAVVIVQLDPRPPAHQPVEDSAGKDLVPRIVADLLPAADHVLAQGEGVQKAWNLGRVVLQVCIEREDDIAVSSVKAGR